MTIFSSDNEAVERVSVFDLMKHSLGMVLAMIFTIGFFYYLPWIMEAEGGGTPIIFDLDRSSKIEITGATTSRVKFRESDSLGDLVRFDLDGDGKQELIEWVAAGSRDGILVDNRDGQASAAISGNRLFGDLGGKFENGYVRLSVLDANHDSKIAGIELIGLAIWVDRNGDATIDNGELRTISEHAISSISLQYFVTEDEDGRYFERSYATTQDGEEFMIEDVYFAEASRFDQANFRKLGF